MVLFPLSLTRHQRIIPVLLLSGARGPSCTRNMTGSRCALPVRHCLSLLHYRDTDAPPSRQFYQHAVQPLNSISSTDSARLYGLPRTRAFAFARARGPPPRRATRLGQRPSFRMCGPSAPRYITSRGQKYDRKRTRETATTTARRCKTHQHAQYCTPVQNPPVCPVRTDANPHPLHSLVDHSAFFSAGSRPAGKYVCR